MMVCVCECVCVCGVVHAWMCVTHVWCVFANVYVVCVCGGVCSM